MSNDSVLYDLQRTGSTGVLIRLTSNDLTENSTLPQNISEATPNNVLLSSEETNLFIPGCELQNIANELKSVNICGKIIVKDVNR